MSPNITDFATDENRNTYQYYRCDMQKAHVVHICMYSKTKNISNVSLFLLSNHFGTIHVIHCLHPFTINLGCNELILQKTN